MKRRKAIGTILLAGTGVALGFGGYEWYSLTKNPERNYLLSKKSLIAELADIIIPETDTPGAREAGAVEFMIPLLTECTDIKTLNKFISGLQDLETYARSQYHRDFAECRRKEQEAIVSHMEQKSRSVNSLIEKGENKYLGRSFFETLKSYSTYGYCISEKGAGLGMRYIAVPGKYLSCIPLEPNQRAWATK